MAIPRHQRADTHLARLLRLSYSGERAAALAYRGHARSVSDPGQRRRLAEIDAEDWHHRARIGEMLDELGGKPSAVLDAIARGVGTVLGWLCPVSGWLAPMFGAGLLESRNIGEYEDAARRALAAGRHEWIDELLTMAEVEWDHERTFRQWLGEHSLWRRLPLWKEPAPRGAIRADFQQHVETLARQPLRRAAIRRRRPESAFDLSASMARHLGP